eukprot:7545579-Pyramimonas_sp.AAC.1
MSNGSLEHFFLTELDLSDRKHDQTKLPTLSPNRSERPTYFNRLRSDESTRVVTRVERTWAVDRETRAVIGTGSRDLVGILNLGSLNSGSGVLSAPLPLLAQEDL